MAEKTYNIIVSGEGGQGVLSIAEIIARAAWLQGHQSLCVPYYSTEKRGGVSTAFAQVSEKPIPFPKFRQADLAVALSQRAVERLLPFLGEKTQIVVNTHLVKDVKPFGRRPVMAIDATALANERLHKPRTFNMIVLGAMLRFVPGLSEKGFAESLDGQFARRYERDPELRDLNRQAIDLGFGLES